MDILSVEAAKYFLESLSLDEVVPVRILWIEVKDAPEHVHKYIKKMCRNVEKFENFLCKHPNFFIVENGRVVHGNSVFGNGGIRAVEYFEDILLDYYNYNPHFMNLRGHLGQAPDNVRDFINTLYKGQRFKNFLESQTDAFTVFPDGTVSLIEDECVEYFEGVLEDYGDGKHYMKLRGHIGQAPKHVQLFINEHYPGKEFLYFLKNNDYVFKLDRKSVYLF